MKRSPGFTVIEVLFGVVILLGTWGWIWNIVKIAGSSFDPITGLVILRCVGIFIPPLGAVMGFL